MIGHPHDARWIDGQFSRLPRHFRAPLRGRYARKYRDEGRAPANLYLLELGERVRGEYVRMQADDGELIEAAERAALESGRAAAAGHDDAAYRAACGVAYRHGIEPPSLDTYSLYGAVERLRCPLWWRRAIRRTHARTVEAAAVDVGLVHVRAGCYASEETVHRRRQQKSRNRRMLEEVQAVNEAGDAYTLAELAALSVSNPVIRRGELMTRIAGFEEWAREAGHVGEFYTITCPSRMHRMKTIRNGAGKVVKVIENPKYDGTTPREAQGHLSRTWARLRACLHRRGLRWYGFRVAEPQHDGTPHWHLLLFYADQWPGESTRRAVPRVRAIMRRYALQEDGHEQGAKQYRFDAKAIDWTRGTAAGYIAKYIAKNIDGYGLDADLYGNDPIAAADRVDAWAATWGIRQFQQVGGPSVVVWRELRRLAAEGEQEGTLGAAMDAADRGDWFGYVKAMGGATVARDAQPVRVLALAAVVAYSEQTGELFSNPADCNRYGEPAAARVIGVKVGNVYHVTRWHDWTMTRASNEQASERQEGEPGKAAGYAEKSYSRAGRGEATGQGAAGAGRVAAGDMAAVMGLTVRAAGAPWSPVNNCTRANPEPAAVAAARAWALGRGDHRRQVDDWHRQRFFNQERATA